MKHRTGTGVAARLVELALLVAVPVVLHFIFPIAVLIPSPYRYLGILVMIAGLLLSTAAGQAFRAAGARFQLHGETPRLVGDGPFRYSRNPMYLGMLLWILGLAMLLGTLSPFLFVLLVFMLLNFSIIPMEERSLRQLHPTEYAAYEGRVRRWL